jgi:alkylhydroperoxidase/carboxymuconolactone decarboxylase family protein YurZ
MAQKHLEDYYRLRTLTAQLSSESEPVMSAFMQFQEQALVSGALSGHIKALMALGMVIALHGHASIATYVYNALQAGATRNEILETIGLALLMGGAPAVADGSEALEALNQF